VGSHPIVDIQLARITFLVVRVFGLEVDWREHMFTKSIWNPFKDISCLTVLDGVRITLLEQLIDGEKYNVYSRYEKSFADEVRWQRVEDKAMEEETLLAMKSFLINHLGLSVIEMPTDIMGSDGETIVQEWDAVFKVDDVLYLCEAKHNMNLKQVKKTLERIQKFKMQFILNAQAEFREVDRIVGLFYGTFFPSDIRESVHRFGFVCVYPSGNRYGVEFKNGIYCKVQFPALFLTSKLSQVLLTL
jgi:hypothetical protein